MNTISSYSPFAAYLPSELADGFTPNQYFQDQTAETAYDPFRNTARPHGRPLSYQGPFQKLPAHESKPFVSGPPGFTASLPEASKPALSFKLDPRSTDYQLFNTTVVPQMTFSDSESDTGSVYSSEFDSAPSSPKSMGSPKSALKPSGSMSSSSSGSKGRAVAFNSIVSFSYTWCPEDYDRTSVPMSPITVRDLLELKMMRADAHRQALEEFAVKLHAAENPGVGNVRDAAFIEEFLTAVYQVRQQQLAMAYLQSAAAAQMTASGGYQHVKQQQPQQQPQQQHQQQLRQNAYNRSPAMVNTPRSGYTYSSPLPVNRSWSPAPPSPPSVPSFVPSLVRPGTFVAPFVPQNLVG